MLCSEISGCQYRGIVAGVGDRLSGECRTFQAGCLIDTIRTNPLQTGLQLEWDEGLCEPVPLFSECPVQLQHCHLGEAPFTQPFPICKVVVA